MPCCLHCGLIRAGAGAPPARSRFPGCHAVFLTPLPCRLPGRPPAAVGAPLGESIPYKETLWRLAVHGVAGFPAVAARAGRPGPAALRARGAVYRTTEKHAQDGLS